MTILEAICAWIEARHRIVTYQTIAVWCRVLPDGRKAYLEVTR